MHSHGCDRSAAIPATASISSQRIDASRHTSSYTTAICRQVPVAPCQRMFRAIAGPSSVTPKALTVRSETLLTGSHAASCGSPSPPFFPRGNEEASGAYAWRVHATFPIPKNVFVRGKTTSRNERDAPTAEKGLCGRWPLRTSWVRQHQPYTENYTHVTPFRGPLLHRDRNSRSCQVSG